MTKRNGKREEKQPETPDMLEAAGRMAHYAAVIQSVLRNFSIKSIDSNTAYELFLNRMFDMLEQEGLVHNAQKPHSALLSVNDRADSAFRERRWPCTISK